MLGFVMLAGYGILKATAHTKLLNFASNLGGLVAFAVVAKPLWLLGGAMATHLRAGSPLFSHLFFGLYHGLIAWGGLYLRNIRLRRLIPLRQDS